MTDLLARLEVAEAGCLAFRQCNVCGDRMVKGAKDTASRWASRRYCSHACHNLSRKGVLPETAATALLRRIEVQPQTGCHNWTGTVQNSGYGFLTFARRKTMAHRLAFETWNGPIPDGQCVCHRCDNRRCINPQHLFLGTDAENTADRNAKGRQARGEGSGRAKLTEADVRAIRTSSDTYAVLSERYGVGQTAIYSIKARRSWAHVE